MCESQSTESQSLSAAELRTQAIALLAQISDDVLVAAARGVQHETNKAHLGWVGLVAAIAAIDQGDAADPVDGPLAPPDEYGAAYADVLLNAQIVG